MDKKFIAGIFFILLLILLTTIFSAFAGLGFSYGTGFGCGILDIMHEETNQ